jgi:hypothetical protein
MSPKIQVYKTAEKMLDTVLPRIVPINSDRKAAIEAALPKLRDAYTRLLEKGSMDFSEPKRRAAFVMRHLAPHACWVHKILSNHKREVLQVVNQRKVTVWSLGGGPGSDVLGFLKFCCEQNVRDRLECLICDREPGWAEFVHLLPSVATSAGLDVSVKLLTTPVDSDLLAAHQTPQIILVVYALSELHKKLAEVEESLCKILGATAEQGLILYVDIAEEPVRKSVDDLFGKWGYERLHGDDDLSLDYQDLPSDEFAKDIGRYFLFEGIGYPTAKLDYRIWKRKAKQSNVHGSSDLVSSVTPKPDGVTLAFES